MDGLDAGVWCAIYTRIWWRFLRSLLAYNMKKTCKEWRFANVIWQAIPRILSVIQLIMNLFVGWGWVLLELSAIQCE